MLPSELDRETDVEAGAPDGPAPAVVLARRARRWAVAAWPLYLTGLLALAVRWMNVLVWRPTCDYDPSRWTAGGFPLEEGVAQAQQVGESCYVVNGDAIFYYGQGKMLAAGEGYGQAFQWLLFGGDLPSAAHPPVYSTFLWLCNAVGLTTVTQQRLASSVVGAIGVVLVAVVARRLGGLRAGVVAGVLAAVYPHLWIADGKLLSETFLVPATALVLLAAYRFWEKPRPGTAVALGAAIAFAQLVRAEMGMLAFLLVGWLAFASLRRRLPGSSWLTLGLLACLSTQLFVLPWTLRNLTSFEHPVAGTTGVGTVLLSGSCDEGFYNEEFLGIYLGCLGEEEQALLFAGADPTQPQMDESEFDAVFRDKALEYLGDNASRVPVVVAARVARIWELYQPLQNAELNGVVEDRGLELSKAALVLYWTMVPLAVVGLVATRRRGLPISPFLFLAFSVTAAVAISFALTRYRIPADVGLVVLAGIGIDVAWRWLTRPVEDVDGTDEAGPVRRPDGVDDADAAAGRRAADDLVPGGVR